jgi:GT2 family glycosyltransferase
VRGKFLFLGDRKLYIRGVTYGTFRPDENGCHYPSRPEVRRDFELMARRAVNTVRVYTVPPRWLLDEAQDCGLRVMVGLPWEQHVTFLDSSHQARDIEHRVRQAVRSCAGHPALLCFAIGNEIPAPIVRWYGARRIQRFLKRLFRAVKQEDPGALVTYVNYPTTEYLDLPFVDFVCFNVYLETEERLAAYLARLQNLAVDKPLVMAEVGFDSRRNGELRQAETLAWQIRTIFARGCAGLFLFAWTDEWFRGGFDIDDWDFGITRRDRSPKPALDAVQRAFSSVPFPAETPWPRISVAVCTYNGSRTLDQTLNELEALEYPDYEIILVDDGSRDGVPQIAAGHPRIHYIRTENRGLSAARNTGMRAATGDIIAYVDDDAYPDPHWLHYLAYTFLNTDHAGVGGPNIPPPGDGYIAECVANAPGGPVHVLLDDGTAEHIPGCNMAFRREKLLAVGGFDPRYRTAGDDVDICWRLQNMGWTIGFNPASVVWHHRRNSVKTYWKQQIGYGRAEALLERKWPEKYNAAGHVSWTGRLYGRGLLLGLGLRSRIYQGMWGAAPFQVLYHEHNSELLCLPMMPEWHLLNFALAGFAALGFFWEPLLWALVLLAISAGLPLLQAVHSVAAVSFDTSRSSRLGRAGRYVLTTCLHVMQPLARLYGRFKHGLHPWRANGPSRLVLPRVVQVRIWSERWRSLDSWLAAVEAALLDQNAIVVRGGEFDRWDLELRGGLLADVRVHATVEEHGAGKQLVRLRAWPRFSRTALAVIVSMAAFSGLALRAEQRVVGATLGILAAVFAIQLIRESSSCFTALRAALFVEEKQRIAAAQASERYPYKAAAMTGSSLNSSTGEVA